jgi:hypothetical protein
VLQGVSLTPAAFVLQPNPPAGGSSCDNVHVLPVGSHPGHVARWQFDLQGGGCSAGSCSCRQHMHVHGCWRAPGSTMGQLQQEEHPCAERHSHPVSSQQSVCSYARVAAAAWCVCLWQHRAASQPVSAATIKLPAFRHSPFTHGRGAFGHVSCHVSCICVPCVLWPLLHGWGLWKPLPPPPLLP